LRRAANSQVLPTIITPAAGGVFTATEAKGMASVTITDIQGRRLITEQFTIVKGINRIGINSAKLARGSYFVRIEGKDWKKRDHKSDQRVKLDIQTLIVAKPWICRTFSVKKGR